MLLIFLFLCRLRLPLTCATSNVILTVSLPSLRHIFFNIILPNLSTCSSPTNLLLTSTPFTPLNLSHPHRTNFLLRYLGILLSPSLSWAPHIDATCNKARKVLNLVFRHSCLNFSTSTVIKCTQPSFLLLPSTLTLNSLIFFFKFFHNRSFLPLQMKSTTKVQALAAI